MTADGTGRGLGLGDPERENAVLLGIIEATASGPGVEPLAAAVARVITEATATDICFVHVLDDTDTALTLAGATPPFDARVGTVHLPLGHGVSGWVAAHHTPAVITSDKTSDPRYLPIPELRGADYTSMVSVPMLSEPYGLAGVLNVHTVDRREFGDRDVRLLLAIGRLLAAALHQARMHRRLRARGRAHERFAEQTVAAQETERRRLARDIHDGISQRLVTLSFHLDAAATLLSHGDAGEARAQLAHASGLVGTTLDEARAAIGALRPPVLDDLGLAGALAALVRDVPDLDVRLDLDERRLPDHVEVALYRIAQEALQNVRKHAGARRVALRLAAGDPNVRLEIADDGRGLYGDLPDSGPTEGGPAEGGPPSGGPTGGGPTGGGSAGGGSADRSGSGYGMASMRERADLIGGTLQVRSRPGSGTTVVVTAPRDTEPADTEPIDEESTGNTRLSD